MRVCTSFLLFGILASTNSIPRIKLHSAPETVSKYYSIGERSGKIRKSYNDHDFQASVTAGNQNVKLVFRAPKVDSFTDFIQETVDILNIYEDGAFKEFFLILDKEIRNYHYKGCKVSELTENTDTKKFLMQTLKMIRGKPVAFTKANINIAADMLRDETYDSSVKELLDYINSLYINSKKNFHKVLSNLNRYRKTKSTTHNDLVQVIRNGIRTILFNHYTELDTHTRRELNARIAVFWRKFKNSLASDTEINDIDKDPVRKTVNKNIDVSKNVINDFESNFKKESQKNLNNKRGRIVNKEIDVDHFQGKEIEEGMKSLGSGESATDYTEEFSSRQSFDSSSNSIKLSQERHEEYNTQRYMTLYTEEISFKAKPTKETETTRRQTFQRRPTTTPRYRNVLSDRPNNVEVLRMNHNKDDTKQNTYPDLSHDTESDSMLEAKQEPRPRPHVDQPRGQSKPDKTKSKSRHKNAQMYSQYDAVIDVQLANTDLLKSLRMFAPLGIGRRESEKYDTSLYPRSAIKRRAQKEMKSQNPTTPTKSASQYSINYESQFKKPIHRFRRISSPSSSNKTVEQNSLIRSSDNDTKDYDDYIIKRISALENELKDLKQIQNKRSKVYKNSTDEVKLSNGTDQRKDMTGNQIEKLSNTNHDLEMKDVIKKNNNDNNTKSYAFNTESTTNNNTYFKLNAITNDVTNATVIGNTTTPQVNNSAVDITNYDIKELKEDVTTDIMTATDSIVDVTDATTAVSDSTAPSPETVVWSRPAYYDYPDRRLDPFDHFNDGLDLNM